jgi:Flp pilus assembly CpaE family ATPase
VIEIARRGYRHTVIDAPRHSAEVIATLASSSTHVLLVFQLCVKDVRLARAMLDSLDEQAVPRGHVIGLVNRYARGSAISLDDASKVLGGGVAVRHLRNDFSAAQSACNFGKSLAEVAPRSPFRRDLQELLKALSTSQSGSR